MDFFGLKAQLDALSEADSSASADPESIITRAWYSRQRDSRRALAECEIAEAGLSTLSAPVARRAAARIALVRAEATWLLGDNDRARALLTSAREIFTDLADFVGIGDACLCEASLRDQAGGDSTIAVRDAAAAYARNDDRLRIALADTWLACIESVASPDSAALRWNATLERARSLSHPGLDTFIEGALASQAYQRGDLAGTVEHFERSFHAALQVGQLFSAITVAQNLGIAFSTLGDDEGAMLWVQRARELVEPTGWPYAINWCLVQSASVLAGMGRTLAAQEMLSQGMPMLERFKESRNYALASQVLAEVALARNEPSQALAWCERSVVVAARLGFPDLASGSLRFKALALSSLQRPDDAMAAAREALAIAHEQGHLRHESTALHAMATISRDHALPPPPDSAAPSGSLHHLRVAFEVQRRSGAGVPAEWLAEMSADLQAAGDLSGALEHQRQATAALAQAKLDKAGALATALQVRQRTESARAEAAQQRALAQASQQQLDLLQARHTTLEERAEVSRQAPRVAQPAPGAAPADAASSPPPADTAMLHLLGKPALIRVQASRTDTLRFLPERRFRLLAYVALHGDGVSRDKLAHLFWPERSQEAARSNLRKLLLEARALDVPQLESDRNALRWTVCTDVADFRAALARGDRDAALALYRGPFLDGLDGGDSGAFSDWLDGERARLHDAWRDAVVAALPERDPAAVIDLTGRLLADDPFDEDALVAALAACHARGDGAGAARLFRTYTERLIDDLGVEPSVRVRAAAVRAETPAQRPGQVPSRRASDRPGAITARALPLPGSGFVGRARELAEISSLLRQADCRLLTVTGPGGMGKSRLVKHAVLQLDVNYSDGVVWIALDDLTEVTQVAPRIASELRLEVGPGKDPFERVCAQLAARHVLLVLDNSEHLGRLSTVVERLLSAAPRLQILSTSRTRIGSPHEWLVPLQGLDLPPEDGTASDIIAADAVQLFAVQAQATDPRFKVSANASLVARLVRALGGMPLAVLLAASWVRLLPMTELLNDVTHSLDVLESTEEGEERAEHRSVRATFEQSWRLLAPAEQRAMAALSVFAGGFKRGAAKDVAQVPLPLLATLVDKSMLQVDGEGRFSLHPLIQQFAAEKLEADVHAQTAARAGHCRHFDLWLRRIADAPRADEPKSHELIDSELENLRAMWHHAIAAPVWDTVASAAVPLMRFFELRSRWSEGQALLDAAADALGTNATEDREVKAARANVWRALATLDFRAGLHARCIEHAERSLALCRELGIRKGIKGNLNNLGLATWQLTRRDEAAAHFAAAIDEARADGDTEGEAIFLGNAAMVAKAQGNYQDALRWSQAALTVHRLRDNKVSTQTTLNNLGNLYRALQEPRQAIAVLTEALAAAKQHSRSSTESFVQCNLALAHADLGEFEDALVHAETALRLMCMQGEPALETSIRQALARAMTGLGRLAEAREHLARSLRLALSERRIGVAVGTLVHWSTVLAAQSHVTQAVEVLAFAVDHPDIDGPDRDFAKRAWDAIEQQLGADRSSRLKSDAPAPTLEALAARLLQSADR